MELPDFHIDHAEKIEWMIETNGWALEPVSARPEDDPPVPSYAYSIGVPAAVGFAEIAVFGLAPAAANGLVTLVVDACRGGTEIPLGVELVGLLDNELRCMFAPVDLDEHGCVLPDGVRLVPGRTVRRSCSCCSPIATAFIPYEVGYDQRMRFAQPILGAV